jgi:hypothetical protein
MSVGTQHVSYVDLKLRILFSERMNSQCRGWVVTTPTSCSGSYGFKFEPGDQLS